MGFCTENSFSSSFGWPEFPPPFRCSKLPCSPSKHRHNNACQPKTKSRKPVKCLPLSPKVRPSVLASLVFLSTKKKTKKKNKNKKKQYCIACTRMSSRFWNTTLVDFRIPSLFARQTLSLQRKLHSKINHNL